MGQAWRWHSSLLPHISLDKIWPHWIHLLAVETEKCGLVVQPLMKKKWVLVKTVFSSTVEPAVTSLFLTRVSQREETTWDHGLPSLFGSDTGQLPHMQAQLPFDTLSRKTSPDIVWHLDFLMLLMNSVSEAVKFMGEPEWVKILISWPRRETNRRTIPHSWPARLLLKHHAGFLEVYQATSGHLAWQQVSPSSAICTGTSDNVLLCIGRSSGCWYTFYLTRRRTWMSQECFLDTYMILTWFISLGHKVSCLCIESQLVSQPYSLMGWGLEITHVSGGSMLLPYENAVNGYVYSCTLEKPTTSVNIPLPLFKVPFTQWWEMCSLL